MRPTSVPRGSFRLSRRVASSRARATNAAEERLRRGHAEEREVVVERLLVDLTRLLRIEQQRLDLRREHEALVVHRVIERLDADAVAHEPELSCARVPEREGEHATH